MAAKQMISLAGFTLIFVGILITVFAPKGSLEGGAAGIANKLCGGVGAAMFLLPVLL